jgi:hypothetical protein
MHHSTPGDSGAQPDDGASETLTEHPMWHALNDLAESLGDGLDHPELWPLLRDVALADSDGELASLITALRPLQRDARLLRIFDLLTALIEAVAGDRDAGIATLQNLEAHDGLCPQIAGALFFAKGLADPARAPDFSTKFCDAPFVKFETLIDGTVAPCCSIWTQKRFGQLDGQSAEALWNSTDAQEMRDSILDGSFRYCNKQRCTHLAGGTLPERDAVADPYLRDIIDNRKTMLERGPNWLFLAHDLTCNLACPSCRKTLLAADEAQEERFAVIEEQMFHPLLEADTHALISLSGQGDPFSSQHYRSLLRYMADRELNIDLELHTNALLLNEKRWAQFAGLEKYRPLINVSIDSCTPWVYEVVRRPGTWAKLEPNLRFIAARRAAGIFREFHLNATVQLDNFHELGDLVDFAGAIGADTMRLYMIQQTGGHLARRYNKLNIAATDHPLHAAFLETLRDPRLGGARAHLYDVALWRERALAASLPSDALAADADVHAFEAAAGNAAAEGRHENAVALCAAAQARGCGSRALLTIEADSLRTLGFHRQATYRLNAAETLRQNASAGGRPRDILLVA